MKIEINLDDKFFEEKFRQYRSASFSNSLALLRPCAGKIRKLNPNRRHPSFLLDSKILTYNFSELLGIKSPKIHQVDCSIEQIVFKRNCVIKPMYEDSARGVFVYDENDLLYLNKNIKFNTIDEAKNHAKNLLNQGIVKIDKWMVEELIGQNGQIARDIKFYMFYGEIGLILESNRIPSLKRCWYDPNLQPVNTGKYTANSFKGDAKDLRELCDIAKKISLELPVPFIRLDFLKVNAEIYLGEFTPIPGGYNKFNQEWDTKLGELYLNATTRICNDVAYGKIFDKYQDLEKNEKKAINNIKSNQINNKFTMYG